MSDILSSSPDPPGADGTRTGNRSLFAKAAGIVVVIAIGLGAWKLTGGRRNSTGDCGIHAGATMVTRDAPISRAMNITTDRLMLRNEDGDTWKDVVVTASGYQKLGTQGRQASGTYTLPPADLHNKGGLYSIEMNDFEKVDGGARWVSLTMTAEVFTVKATVNGRTCSIDVTPTSK
jgi:hypothetical protein